MCTEFLFFGFISFLYASRAKLVTHSMIMIFPIPSQDVNICRSWPSKTSRRRRRGGSRAANTTGSPRPINVLSELYLGLPSLFMFVLSLRIFRCSRAATAPLHFDKRSLVEVGRGVRAVVVVVVLAPPSVEHR
eukprot:PhM_4_TR18082/c1_g1_i1/m.102117